MQLLLVGLFLVATLFANNPNTLDSNNSTDLKNNTKSSLEKEDTSNLQKVLYLSYKETPTRVIKGGIFKVTIKSLSTTNDFTDIVYELSNSRGLKLLSDFPAREIDSRYYYETFYFLVTSTNARLPDFTAELLNYNNKQFKKTLLEGNKLNVVELNPKKNFSNIVAESFSLIDYKTTSYDSTHNIIIFAATATNCDIASFKLNNIYKQGIESIVESYFESKITYYAIVDKKMENLAFSYFNLKNNKFELINIPIVVDDDSVTTQSDLKPTNQSRERLKMTVAGAVALVGFLIILWRKKYIYLILIIFPLAYIIYIGVPSKEVCIKQNSDIHLLPVINGTIFETTFETYYLQKEGKAKNWTKVQLKNKKIGWVKDEDICSR
ncbi:MAG: hypothetical protein L3J19_05820 [Sulfurimonas sp.]|nr:hypothetical protein [Sulfurimonas sp.]